MALEHEFLLLSMHFRQWLSMAMPGLATAALESIVTLCPQL
jgi:hypothetical protein